MYVPKACIGIFIFITFIGQIHANIDRKENFCGRKLSRTLHSLCLMYNSPPMGIQRRYRRQIIQECCKSQCSRRYLIQYYCSVANASALNMMKSPPQEETTNFEVESRDYQSDDALVASGADEQAITVGTVAEDVNYNKAFHSRAHQFDSSPSYHNKISGRKRRCKCRKRRAKRVKKFQPFVPAKSNRNFQNSVPPPNIGQIEGSQQPFYVWKYPKLI